MSHHEHHWSRSEFYNMLLSEDRKKWQNPETILEMLGLKRSMIAADLACGPGFFSLPAAKVLGANGRLYCVDADPEATEICARRLRGAGYRNFEIRVGRLEAVRFESEVLDRALIANSLHDLEDPVAALGNVHDSLKPEGLLGVVDWKKSETPMGPPPDIRMTEEQEEELLRKAGFSVLWTKQAGPYHYMILAAAMKK
ncbi:MAG: class I SAM-dependent methyltransferase [Thermoprotei archaeon]